MVLCTTAERLQEILNAIKIAEIYTEVSIESKFDILEALAFLDNPQDAPCFPPCEEQEDTLTDTLAELADGIVTTFQEGGIVKALGYLIEQTGEIIIDVAGKIAEFTVIGLGVAGVITILIGATTYLTIPVAVGETVAPIIHFPQTAEVIRIVFDAVA